MQPSRTASRSWPWSCARPGNLGRRVFAALALFKLVMLLGVLVRASSSTSVSELLQDPAWAAAFARLPTEKASEGSATGAEVASVAGHAAASGVPASTFPALSMPEVPKWFRPPAAQGGTPDLTRTPLAAATPLTKRIELPAGCDSLDDTPLGSLIDLAVHAYINSLHLPSAPSPSRSRLWLGGGASAVLYDQSTRGLSVGSSESAMCSEGKAEPKHADQADLAHAQPNEALSVATSVDGRPAAEASARSRAEVEGVAPAGPTRPAGSALDLDEPVAATTGGGPWVGVGGTLGGHPGQWGEVKEGITGGLGGITEELGHGLGGFGGGLGGVGSSSTARVSGLYGNAAARAEEGLAVAHSWLGVGKTMLVRLYGIRAAIHAQFELDSTITTRLLVGSGGGTIDADVAGVLMFDRVDLDSLLWSGGRNGTIRDCFGIFGIATLAVTGAIERFENHSQPVNSAALAAELCYGPDPAAWDASLGPRPRGLVTHINQAIMEWLWPVSGKMPFGDTADAADTVAHAPASASDTLASVLSSTQHLIEQPPGALPVVGQPLPGIDRITALQPVRCSPDSETSAAPLCQHDDEWRWIYSPKPPPPPPFQSCDCSWTDQYACPSWPAPGSLGFATDDGGECFDFCCCTCEWVEEYACPGSEVPGIKGYATDDGGVCFRECCVLDEGDNTAAIAVGGGTLLLVAGLVLLG